MNIRPFLTAFVPAMVVGAVVCVLGFQQTGSAQQRGTHEPFANSVAQQAEMIQLLKEINQQLKEQNALLKHGSVHVVVDEIKTK